MSGESSLIDSWSGGPVATKHDGQQNMKPLRADAERLTSELVVIDVWVFAKVEHLE